MNRTCGEDREYSNSEMICVAGEGSCITSRWKMKEGNLTLKREDEFLRKKLERIGPHTGMFALPCAWVDNIDGCKGGGVSADHGCMRAGSGNDGMKIRGHQSGQVLKEEKSNNQSDPYLALVEKKR